MDREILFFDIDGTLVDSETHLVPESTKKALQLLKQAGHLLCISTGRSMQSIINGGFDQLATWDMYLCNNGQAIFDRKKQLVNMTPIPKESVEACIQAAETTQSPLFIMGEEEILTREPNTYVYTATEFFKEVIPQVRPYQGEDVIMMIAYGPMDYAYEEYKAIDSIDVMIGQSTYADIVLKGFSKAVGIDWILNYFQMQEYIAFGDSRNDLEMLQQARISVVMGNGHEDAKRCADIITDSVSEDGIYHALQKLHMI